MTEFTITAVLLGMGAAAGFVFQRSRLCFVSALRDLYLFRAVEMTRAILLVLLLLSGGGWVLSLLRAAEGLPVLVLNQPGAVLIATGSAIFGAGMVLTGSCAAGAFWRLGEGEMSQWWILLGLLGGYQAGNRFGPGLDAWSVVQRSHPAVSVTLLLAGVLGFTWWASRQSTPGEELGTNSRLPLLRRPWAPAAGAAVLAILLLVTLAVTGQTWRVTRAFLLSDIQVLGFVVGLVAGGHLGARWGREWRIRKTGSWPQRALRLAGGILMGLGARISWGCTVGALMSGMALGASQAWIWGAGAVAGAYLGTWLLRRLLSFPR